MIEAVIHRKLKSSEDVLTSCCIGLLELLPESYLLEFINKAVNLDGNQLLSLGLSPLIKSIDFWPGFPSGRCPEIVIESESYIIIIEIKHGAPLSSENQLAKYWSDGYKKYSDKKIVLIYLTHHRLIPEDDLKTSEGFTKKEFSHCGNFYWLSWVTLFRTTDEWLSSKELGFSEKKILESLRRYLIHEKYTCFLHWNELPKTAVKFSRYVHAAKAKPGVI